MELALNKKYAFFYMLKFKILYQSKIFIVNCTLFNESSVVALFVWLKFICFAISVCGLSVNNQEPIFDLF